jgi:hypothetical protein
MNDWKKLEPFLASILLKDKIQQPDKQNQFYLEILK